MVKSPAKLQRQMIARGWTAAQIEEAVSGGIRYKAVNYATSGPATHYVHPVTGRSVIIDDASGKVIHVGGDNFDYSDLRLPPR